MLFNGFNLVSSINWQLNNKMLPFMMIKNIIVLVSLELDEVMNVSDRIAVMYEGKIVGIVDAKTTDENTLGLMMAGGAVDGK